VIIVIKIRDCFYYENILVCIINDGGNINKFKLITDQVVTPIVSKSSALAVMEEVDLGY